jgi:hypothetical protein
LPALERLGREEIRVKVGRYLAAGHRDADELTYAEETRPRHAQETVDVGRIANAKIAMVFLI